jgi:hypothetical protein
LSQHWIGKRSSEVWGCPIGPQDDIVGRPIGGLNRPIGFHPGILYFANRLAYGGRR